MHRVLLDPFLIPSDCWFCCGGGNSHYAPFTPTKPQLLTSAPPTYQSSLWAVDPKAFPRIISTACIPGKALCITSTHLWKALEASWTQVFLGAYCPHYHVQWERDNVKVYIQLSVAIVVFLPSNTTPHTHTHTSFLVVYRARVWTHGFVCVKPCMLYHQCASPAQDNSFESRCRW